MERRYDDKHGHTNEMQTANQAPKAEAMKKSVMLSNVSIVMPVILPLYCPLSCFEGGIVLAIASEEYRI